MMKLSASVLAVCLVVPTMATANDYSTQECVAWFKAVDKNRDGSLSRNEGADAFLARVTLASDEQNSNGGFTMQRAFFLAECANGSLGKPKY